MGYIGTSVDRNGFVERLGLPFHGMLDSICIGVFQPATSKAHVVDCTSSSLFAFTEVRTVMLFAGERTARTRTL
jgi:hypothetical protein